MALVFREYNPLTMHECLRYVDNYESTLQAYIQFVPIRLLAKKVTGVKNVVYEESWSLLRAAQMFKELNADEVDPEQPDIVKDTVRKLHLIKLVVAKRITWADDLYLHTLAQKIDNYLLKIKLTEYGDWNDGLWGNTLVTDGVDVSREELQWASLLCSADDKSIEQHTKVLVDKLEIAKTIKVRKTFANPEQHATYCEALGVGIYDFTEEYIDKMYNQLAYGVK